MKTTAAVLAQKLDAFHNCQKSGNTEWRDKWEARIEAIMTDAPSGSGIDSGTELDWEKSNGNKLVFTTAYHHMNEHGMYCGWTEHTVTVKPHLYHGFTLTISGRNRNDIKDYLHEIFSYWLSFVEK